MSHQTALSCWVISDGRRGIENQALGLAEALDRLRPLNIEIMQMESSAVFKAAAPRLQFSLKSTPQDYDLPMPLPEIAIGSLGTQKKSRERYFYRLYSGSTITG